MSVKGKVPLVSSSKLTCFRTLLLDTFFAFLSNVFGDERSKILPENSAVQMISFSSGDNFLFYSSLLPEPDVYPSGEPHT